MVLSLLGYVCIAYGVTLVGMDVFRSARTRGLSLESLGGIFSDWSADTLNILQSVIERHIWPPIWDPGIVSILQIPASLFFLLLGLFFVYVVPNVVRR